MQAETRIEAMIETIDNLSTEESVNQCMLGISAALDSVRREAQRRISSALIRAASDFRVCLDEWQAARAACAGIEASMKALGPVGVIVALVALIYLAAAYAGFRTEDILTASLAYLLNLKANDSAAIWLRIAFAASLLLFEFLIVRLRLLDDPWPLLRDSTPEDAARRGYRARVAAGVIIIAAMLATGALQLQSIVKMAPTREQAMIMKRDAANPEAPPIPVDEKVVGEAVLWFSICVLFSSGYLAAAGIRDLKRCTAVFFLRFRSLKDCTKRLEASRAKLDNVAAPALAGELASCGLPYVWLLAPEVTEMRIEGLSGEKITVPGILEAAEKESQVYEAHQRHILEDARARRRSPRSALERVDLTLGEEA